MFKIPYNNMYNNIGRRPLFNPSREYYFRHETELVTITLITLALSLIYLIFTQPAFIP